MRGNGFRWLIQSRRKGSIPALAGERLCEPGEALRDGVYPRACGGTRKAGIGLYLIAGLSPRLRGNGPSSYLSIIQKGSIPALAGEREPGPGTVSWPRVYPRACGGTTAASFHAVPSVGLSPRLRGNGLSQIVRCRRHGSIPALAGERADVRCSGLAAWVYPRACGGTSPRFWLRRTSLGLSPRLRGNATRDSEYLQKRGSIPALAGERQLDQLWRDLKRVYPRACGGTFKHLLGLSAGSGLSPRLRGNGIVDSILTIGIGSIPALAGEREISLHVRVPNGVYPRACGGTLSIGPRNAGGEGLSPRLRGNAMMCMVFGLSNGSIPALAGERF